MPDSPDPRTARKIERRKRWYQCPGCWSVGLWSVPRDIDRPETGHYTSLECACGERLTCIDLRSEISS